MIQKQSYVYPSDTCNIWILKSFHLFKGFKVKFIKINKFLKGSVKSLKINNWILKKKKYLSFFFRSRYNIIYIDNTVLNFKYNNIIILKKRLTSLGNLILGPIPNIINRKKLKQAFFSKI